MSEQQREDAARASCCTSIGKALTIHAATHNRVSTLCNRGVDRRIDSMPLDLVECVTCRGKLGLERA